MQRTFVLSSPECQSGVCDAVRNVLVHVKAKRVVVLTDARAVIPFTFVHRRTVIEVNPLRGTKPDLVVAVAFRTIPPAFSALLLSSPGILVAPLTTLNGRVV